MSLSTPALAACSCIVPSADGGSFERPWAGREVVFTGYAIHVESVFDTAQKHHRTNVLFVTEESWRGALPDTVSLFIDTFTCEFYARGYRYLVAGNWDKAQPSRLLRRSCDYSWSGNVRADQLRKEEGPPDWVAPPAFQRSINEGAIRLGTPLNGEEGPGKAYFNPFGKSWALFEIGASTITERSRRSWYLDPGLYQVRITWPDGEVSAGFVLMRCPQTGDCFGPATFDGLRATPPTR